MPIPPPRTPADWFAGIILHLSLTLDGHSTWGRLPKPLALLILDRLRAIQQRFRRIADRITAGIFPQRRSPAPRRHTGQKPRRPDPLPQGFGWLVRLVLETAPYGGQLQYLFADPEMAALMQAAPAPLRRPLRSLCRMLGVAPPPILQIRRKNPSPATPETEEPVPQRQDGEGAAQGIAPAGCQHPPPPPANLPTREPPLAQPATHACGPPLLLPA